MGLSSVYVVADEDSETVVGAALKAVETYINLTDWSVTDSWTDDAGRLWLEFGYDPSL